MVSVELAQAAQNERRLIPEQSPSEQAAIAEAFRGIEIYDPASPITLFMQEQVANLCDEGQEVPPVLVVKDESLNGFAIGGMIVVNDGATEKLEYKEELYALLGHERRHVMSNIGCRQGPRSPLQSLGTRRSGEIEADLMAMRDLDAHGINPMGMVSLADKLTKEEMKARQDGRPDYSDTNGKQRSPNYFSLQHGSSTERSINAEQLLGIIDTKYLSSAMQPLEVPESLGQTVKLGDPAFWRLPIPVQQAVLQTQAARTPDLPSHTPLQEHILRNAAAANAIEERDISRKAQLLLGGTFSELTPCDPEQLERDLELLEDLDVRSLVGPGRQSIKNVAMESHLKGLLLEDDIDPAKIELIANVVRSQQQMARQPSVTTGKGRYYHPVAAMLNPKLLSSLDERHLQMAPTKISRFLTATRFTYQDMAGHMKDLMDKKPVLVTGTVQQFANTVIKQIDQLSINSVDQIPTLMEKVRRIAELSLTDECTSYLEWGVGDKLIDSKYHERQEGGFANHIDNMICTTDPSTLTADFLRMAQDIEDPKTIRQMAELLITALVRRGNTFSDINSWSALLPILLTATRNEDLGKTIASEHSILVSLYGEPKKEKLPFKQKMAGILHRLKAAQKGIDQLELLLPGVLELDIEEAIEESAPIRQALLHKALNGYVSPRGNSKELVGFLSKYSTVRLQTGELYNTRAKLELASDLWAKAADKVLTSPEWIHSEEHLLVLATLGMIAPDVEVNLTVPNFAFRRIAQMRDFEGGLQLLEDFPHARQAHGAILNVLMEEKAQTAEDFERLNSLIESLYLDVLAENSGIIGAASIGDAIAIPFYSHTDVFVNKVGHRTNRVEGLESEKLLAALLASGHDESSLKEYIAKRWWFSQRNFRKQELESQFTVEDYLTYRHPSKSLLLQYWLAHDYPPQESYTPFDEDLSNAYLLTSPARFFAVRKLLLSEGDGVLKTEEGGEKLVNALMESWLADSDGQEDAILRDLLLELVKKNDAAATYLHIAPVLQHMILKPPKEGSDLKKATRAIAQEVLNTLVANKQIRDAPTDRDLNTLHLRIHRLFTGYGTAQTTTSATRQLELASIKKRLLGAIGATDTEVAAKRLSTVGFAALAGKQSGALGIKMLQLGGQYFKLSEEDAHEFDEVYDDMIGQTRLQAYNILKREAQDNPDVATLFSSIKHFGQRVGGGSLFTVYKVELTDGRIMALGVRNPNAEYRIKRLTEFMAIGLDGAAAKRPHSTVLRMMSALLEDATQWVRDELADEEFSVKDRIFRDENDTRVGAGFKSNNSSYELTTPNTIYTNSSRIRCEEFIEGTNLTKLHIVENAPSDISANTINGTDFKQVVSLIVRDFTHQVARGTYAHSDIHRGNFRVALDNTQVAIFDRHNLIPIHQKLRETAQKAFTSIVTGDQSGAIMAIALHAAPDAADPDEIRAVIQRAATSSGDPSQAITDALLALKGENIEVPLDLSLLLRNFMSVSQLSNQAGFSNLLEAFMHTSSGMNELASLLS